MKDKTRQSVQPADEPKQPPQEQQRLLPTPQQFYRKLVEREDIRAILKRLANN